jgi:NADH-quinone oxidoreductase subunit L
MTPAHLAFLLLAGPLASAGFTACFLRRRGAAAAALSVGVAGLVLAGALYLSFSGVRFEIAKEWLSLGGLVVSFGFKFDDLAALMLVIVALVGFCVHVFSLGYMSEDAAKARYFAGLSVFMFSMTGIVLADNLFMMFIYWEFVGFSSWLLINHWHERPAASAAAKKAFITNRVGDFGFLLGILMCYWTRGTVNLTDLAVQASSGFAIYSRALPLLLFCGAIGKSAQLPLQVWLPDAMEGPTPVSALIHAATMVAAGIYMLCRIQMLMVPQALEVIQWVGTATALYAALCAVAQRDIKKVLAYSTLSQLGYMVAAFGLGSVEHRTESGELVLVAAGVGAAMFHLTTHAFFKALLFLGSGSVIHGCHNEQDIFRMGGLARRMKFTYVTFTIAVAAIVGLPFFAGFFSKEAILALAFEQNRAIFAVLALTAALTAFYMLRCWRLVFLGAPRSPSAEHAHESGITMQAPLGALAVLAAIGGFRGLYPRAFAGVLNWALEPEGAARAAVLATSLAVLIVGGSLALVFYSSAAIRRAMTAAADNFIRDPLELSFPFLFGALVALRDSFDTVYEYYIGKIQQRFAMLLNFFDLLGVGGLVRAVAGMVGLAGLQARALHVGRLNVYIYWFLAGVAVFWAFAAGVF